MVDGRFKELCIHFNLLHLHCSGLFFLHFHGSPDEWTEGLEGTPFSLLHLFVGGALLTFLCLGVINQKSNVVDFYIKFVVIVLFNTKLRGYH